MDMSQFYTEARRRIESELPPEYDVTSMSSGGKFGGFKVRKKAAFNVKPVINVPVEQNEEKIVYRVEPMDPSYAELATKIGKKLAEIS